MKAIVLSGGYATRLRPISYALPKLLFPVLGKPMVHWTLDMLKRFGVHEVVLAVNYLADMLRDAIGEHYKGMRVRYSSETFPLGTAGPIRLAGETTSIDDTFIAMNGDIITQIDLAQMLKQHRQSGAAITDALHKVRDPTRFGVVELGPANCILRFVEKPSMRDAPSRLVNAGIYLIEPNVLKMVPLNKKISLEREIFPALAKKSKLYGYPFDGNWFDIGNMADFRRANFTLLEQTISQPRKQLERKQAKSLDPSLLLGRSVIGRGASVGPYVIAGENLSVLKGSHISRSILFDDVKVGSGASVVGATIGSNVRVGNGARICDGSIISPHVKIGDGVTIGIGALIHPYKEITANVRRKANVM